MFCGYTRIKECTHWGWGQRNVNIERIVLSDLLARRGFLVQQTEYTRHEKDGTGMRRITTFRSTTGRIYDGGPIRL